MTKYTSQNSKKGHLCHLSNKFVDKTIKILEYSYIEMLRNVHEKLGDDYLL